MFVETDVSVDGLEADIRAGRLRRAFDTVGGREGLVGLRGARALASGSALARLVGDHGLSMKLVARARKREPTNPYVRYAWARWILASRGAYDGTLALAELLNERDAQRIVVGCREALAITYALLRDFDTAWKYLHEARECGDEDSYHHATQAVVLLHEGRNAESLASARRALDLAPTNASCVEVLVRSLRAEARDGEAKAVLESALGVIEESFVALLRQARAGIPVHLVKSL